MSITYSNFVLDVAPNWTDFAESVRPSKHKIQLIKQHWLTPHQTMPKINCILLQNHNLYTQHPLKNELVINARWTHMPGSLWPIWIIILIVNYSFSGDIPWFICIYSIENFVWDIKLYHLEADGTLLFKCIRLRKVEDTSFPCWLKLYHSYGRAAWRKTLAKCVKSGIRSYLITILCSDSCVNEVQAFWDDVRPTWKNADYIVAP